MLLYAPNPNPANTQLTGRKLATCYLEAEDTADEEQNEEHQAEVAESSDLVLVGEVIRLQRKKDGGGAWTLLQTPAVGGRAFPTSCCR